MVVDVRGGKRESPLPPIRLCRQARRSKFDGRRAIELLDSVSVNSVRNVTYQMPRVMTHGVQSIPAIMAAHVCSARMRDVVSAPAAHRPPSRVCTVQTSLLAQRTEGFQPLSFASRRSFSPQHEHPKSHADTCMVVGESIDVPPKRISLLHGFLQVVLPWLYPNHTDLPAATQISPLRQGLHILLLLL